jgi:malonyl-CoA O-methyltransferase
VRFTINRVRRWLRRKPRTLTSIDAYALWAANYPPHAHNPLMELEQQALLDLLPPLDGAALLDLACGTGRYALLGESRGAARVIGIDNSADMLERNALRWRVRGTMTAIPVRSDSIDVAICALALGHMPELPEAVSEIGRVLRPGGTALISDMHPFIALNGGLRTFTGADGRIYAVEHYAHLYEDMLRAAADAGLRIDAVTEPRYHGAPVVIVYRLIKAA